MASADSAHTQELRAELRTIEQRVRELQNASIEKDFIDSFMERAKEEREELAVLTARWRVLVPELDGQPVPTTTMNGKPKTHAHAFARAYDELCEENSG